MSDNNEENFDYIPVEPEWCETCSYEMPECGLEYTFDYYISDGVYYCEHCNRPI